MKKSQLKEFIKEILREITIEEKGEKKADDSPKTTPTPKSEPKAPKADAPAPKKSSDPIFMKTGKVAKKKVAAVAPPVNKVTPLDAIRLAQKVKAARQSGDEEKAAELGLAHRAANALVKGQRL